MDFDILLVFLVKSVQEIKVKLNWDVNNKTGSLYEHKDRQKYNFACNFVWV
jgi:hypothetical protein